MNKKYLIASGCSFTEGHKLGSKASWATHLAQELDLELINLGRGGTGNEIITQTVINHATMRSDIAKDSFFVIQLSECMRYLVNYDDDEKSIYWHITPSQFIKDTGFDNWKMTGEPWNKHIYDNRDALAPFFSNITFTLVKTYWNIINFVNFCENNDYPYLIFDGINNHIPYEENDKWYLAGSDPDNERFEVSVSNDYFDTRYHAILFKDLIDYVKSLKHYYNDTTLQLFCNKRDDDDYHKGNGGHPNELGSKMWAKHLVKIIGENNNMKVSRVMKIGRIHSFGCSFTAGHNGDSSKGEESVSDRETYIEHLRKLFIGESNWSEGSDGNIFQYAHGGVGNHYIFRNVMSRLDQFHEKDIVIIQWTSPYRYELPHRENDVYFSLPYTNWVVHPNTIKLPEDANPDTFNDIYKVKDYKKSTESVILNHMNEKWLREMSYHFQYALYNTLESLKIKHIQFFGWNGCSNALITKLKFLDKCFLHSHEGSPIEKNKKEPIAPNAPRHPNKREHKEMAVKLYDSLKKLYNI